MAKAERERLMQQLLHMTRMEPFRKRQATNLSGGMKQKLALMCTLLHHPQVLFLDEPTNGVDPVSRRDFWAILYQLVRDGMTVFVTTAYLDEAERCNRVGLMNNGKLIRCESPQALKHTLEEDCYEVADLRPARRARGASVPTRRAGRGTVRRQVAPVPYAGGNRGVALHNALARPRHSHHSCSTRSCRRSKMCSSA